MGRQLLKGLTPLAWLRPKRMRIAAHPIQSQFLERWSRRAYDSGYRLTPLELESLFEAARWSPSSSNEQPWKFYYPRDEMARTMFQTFVNENNREWAVRASHIIVVCARKNFVTSGKVNPHAWYDTGAAVMALVLQAQSMGLAARQMAGILRDQITLKLGIDSTAEDIICAVAIGRAGDAAQLSEKHQALEKPNTRKNIGEFTVGI
jgi:nitroreductase